MAEDRNRKARRSIAKLESRGNVVRVFDYVIGKEGEVGYTVLKFSLRTDIKDELKNYVGLLEKALEDVKTELANKN